MPVEYSGVPSWSTTITSHYETMGYTPYRWFQADRPPELAPMAQRLSKARVGILTTAGAYTLGQEAFHYKDDTSIREIATSTPSKDVRFSHITENYLA